MAALAVGVAGGIPAAAGDTVMIGAAVAQSGVASQFDTPPMQMVRIAVDDLNARGGILGRQVELAVADTGSRVDQGRVAAESLVADGADFMLVTCDFDFGSPAANVAQENGIVVFSLCAQSPKFGVQGIGPLAYTAAPATYTEGAVLAEFAATRKGFDTAFLLIDDTIAYDVEVCDGFRSRWESHGRTIVGEALYKNDDASIRPQINQIQRAAPEMVLVCGYTPGAPSAMRQLRAAGYQGSFLAPNTLDGTFWLDTIPDVSDLYVTATRSVYGDDPSPVVAKAVAAHRAAFGDRPISGFALSGYAAVEAMARAAERAGTTEGRAVAAALDAFRGEELLVGPTSFSESLHINTARPMAIIEYRDGAPTYLATIDPGAVALPGF